MKKNLLIILCIGVFVTGSCEDDNEFNEVGHEVYSITNIIKKGCFDDDDDITDTNAISPVVLCSSTAEIINSKGVAEFCADYQCHAKDSFNLKGNVLRLYLRPTELSMADCNCNYVWSFEFDVIENVGLKILYYEYENGSYIQKQEMYNHTL